MLFGDWQLIGLKMESKKQDCGFMTCYGCPFVNMCYKEEETLNNKQHG